MMEVISLKKTGFFGGGVCTLKRASRGHQKRGTGVERREMQEGR